MTNPTRRTVNRRSQRGSNKRRNDSGAPRQTAASFSEDGMEDEQCAFTPRQMGYIVPETVLPSILGESGIDVDGIRHVIRLLRVAQDKATKKHKFHLIVESEREQIETNTSQRLQQVVTRVLFSPTLTMENVGEDEDVAALIRILNALSWKAGSRPLSGDLARAPDHTTVVTGQDHRRSAQTTPLYNGTGGQRDEEHRDVARRLTTPRRGLFVPVPCSRRASWPQDVREFMVWPKWFPFRYNKYTEGPQTSSEIVFLTSGMVEQFQFLETFQIVWIYTEFFGFMHKEARRKRIPGVSNTLKYSQFTPPWIRSQLVKGDPKDIHNQNPVFLEEVCVPGLRHQRNAMGYKRIAYILGAFYMKEEMFAREALEHLLRIKPTFDDAGIKRRRLNEAAASPVGGNRIAEEGPSPETGSNFLAVTAAGEKRICISEGKKQTGGAEPGNTCITSPRRRTIDRPNHEEFLAPMPQSRENRKDVQQIQSSNDDEDDEALGADNDAKRPVGSSSGSTHRYARRLTIRSIDLDAEGDERGGENRADDGTGNRGRSQEPERDGGGQERHRNLYTTESDSEVQEEDEFPDIPVPHDRCANGFHCRFAKDNPNSVFNGPGAISGKCRKCAHALHDLCGGGEEGSMICNRCLKERQRNRIALT